MKIEYTISSEIIRQKPFKVWRDFSLLSGILLLSMLVPPFYYGEFTLCLFKNITGLPCPGCGMTRAFLFLGHGKIHEAVILNPNSLLIFPIIVFLWLNEVVYMATGKDVKIHLTYREKIFLYFLSGLLMLFVWGYNLVLNQNLQ
jgi:hypothetical protein